MKCQAEDQGGWPACANEATLQTKREPRRYYCDEHELNRHVWRKEEVEPIPPAPLVPECEWCDRPGNPDITEGQAVFCTHACRRFWLEEEAR